MSSPREGRALETAAGHLAAVLNPDTFRSQEGSEAKQELERTQPSTQCGNEFFNIMLIKVYLGTNLAQAYQLTILNGANPAPPPHPSQPFSVLLPPPLTSPLPSVTFFPSLPLLASSRPHSLFFPSCTADDATGHPPLTSGVPLRANKPSYPHPTFQKLPGPAAKSKQLSPCHLLTNPIHSHNRAQLDFRV